MTGRAQVRQVDLMLVIATAPLWMVAILLLGAGTGRGAANGYVFVFLILTAITFALNRLTKRLAIVAFLAPFCGALPILFISLTLALIGEG